MSDMHKRRFWRIHLSTAVMITMVAGALVGINFNEKERILTELKSGDKRLASVWEISFGWPWTFRSYAKYQGPENIGITVDSTDSTHHPERTRRHEGMRELAG